MLDFLHAAMQAIQTDRCPYLGGRRGAPLAWRTNRPRWDQFQRVWSDIGRKALTWESYASLAQMGLNLSLMILTVAYLVMRLVPPRPSWPALIRQPGTLSLGIMIALSILLLLLSPFVPLVPWTNVPIALAHGLSWLAACRRYRS